MGEGNIESSAGKYIKKIYENQGTDETRKVTKAMRNISDALYNPDTEDSLYLADDKLWDYSRDDDGTLDRDEYNDIFNQLNDKYGVEISDEDKELLFQILDTDGSSSLSKSEIEFLMDKKGITGYSLIHALGTRDDNVEDYVEAHKNSIFGNDSTSEDVSQNEDKTTFPATSQSQTQANNPSTEQSTVTFSVENYRNLIETLVNQKADDNLTCPQNIIDEWFANGRITETQAQELVESYYSFAEDDAESQIEKYRNETGLSRAEAISDLANFGLITVLTDSNTPLDDSKAPEQDSTQTTSQTQPQKEENTLDETILSAAEVTERVSKFGAKSVHETSLYVDDGINEKLMDKDSFINSLYVADGYSKEDLGVLFDAVVKLGLSSDELKDPNDESDVIRAGLIELAKIGGNENTITKKDIQVLVNQIKNGKIELSDSVPEKVEIENIEAKNTKEVPLKVGNKYNSAFSSRDNFIAAFRTDENGYTDEELGVIYDKLVEYGESGYLRRYVVEQFAKLNGDEKSISSEDFKILLQNIKENKDLFGEKEPVDKDSQGNDDTKPTEETKETQAPTVSPTPSEEVTSDPTATPETTAEETQAPTVSPTSSEEVTSEPTATPETTAEETQAPTVSPTPSEEVTPDPTATPETTAEETQSPTTSPTPSIEVTPTPESLKYQVFNDEEDIVPELLTKDGFINTMINSNSGYTEESLGEFFDYIIALGIQSHEYSEDLSDEEVAYIGMRKFAHLGGDGLFITAEDFDKLNKMISNSEIKLPIEAGQEADVEEPDLDTSGTATYTQFNKSDDIIFGEKELSIDTVDTIINNIFFQSLYNEENPEWFTNNLTKYSPAAIVDILKAANDVALVDWPQVSKTNIFSVIKMQCPKNSDTIIKILMTNIAYEVMQGNSDATDLLIDTLFDGGSSDLGIEDCVLTEFLEICDDNSELFGKVSERYSEKYPVYDLLTKISFLKIDVSDRNTGEISVDTENVQLILEANYLTDEQKANFVLSFFNTHDYLPNLFKVYSKPDNFEIMILPYCAMLSQKVLEDSQMTSIYDFFISSVSSEIKSGSSEILEKIMAEPEFMQKLDDYYKNKTNNIKSLVTMVFNSNLSNKNKLLSDLGA